MHIINLRTNHLVNPLGFQMEQPVFSWTVEDASDDKQAWARVRVGLTPELSNCLWDSGEKADLSCLGTAACIDLQPRTRYYWQVTVMGDAGEKGESEIAWFETAKMDEPWQARWIAAPFQEHPVLSKRVTLRQTPVCARIYCTGLGVYELSANGRTVGDEVLAPFYNDYNNWLQYQTYDVTDMLDAGDNEISVMLGNGWFMGRFGFVKDMKELYGNRMQLLCEVRVRYADGSEDTFATDASWQCRPSPALESSIYDGEVWDAHLENSGAPAVSAVSAEAPNGALKARLSPPLCICDTIKPAALLHTKADEWVLDFGQNMTGWMEFDCDLPDGAKVLLQCGELLQNDCFYNENLRTAKEEFTYISVGKPAHVRPHFTFYGFRYIKVTGMDVRPEDFVGCVIHSDLAVTGKLSTSNEKVNQLIHNAFWGQIGNFVDVPTDCPQRDERMGWTGDAHVFAPTASFNMYTPAFYHKFLTDMLLEQRELGGSVPHVVPDVLDQIAFDRGEPQTAHGSCAWGDAAVGIPWTLYNFYGDRSLLEAEYENMKLWVDWIHRQDDEKCGGGRLWTCGFHFADWLALDNPEQGSSFGGTDPYFIASAYYYDSTRLTAKAARALGRDEDAARYEALAEEVRQAMQKEYFTPTGRIAAPTQTAIIMALSMGIAPEEHRERLKRDLRAKLEARAWHMDTGFVGTYYLLRTLTQNGMGDIAYTLLLNEDYPSWLYEVNMGATTVWERWNSVLPNGLVSDTGMNSMNHYAYGSVVEWMYRCMCGINPVEAAPGFKKCVIAPHTDGRLEWARAEYDSAAGKYVSGWKRTQAGVEYEIAVPFDCEADFVPEDAHCRVTLDGREAVPTDGKLALTAGKHVILCA